MQDNGQPIPALPGDGAGESISPAAPHLIIEAIDGFNYAAWQNAVPLLRRVEVDNRNGADHSSVTVKLRATPGFVRPKRWTIDRVLGGKTVALRNSDLEMDTDFLRRPVECERGGLSAMGELSPCLRDAQRPDHPGAAEIRCDGVR